MILFITFLSFAISYAALLFAIFMILPLIIGAPYVPTAEERVAKMVSLVKVKPHEKAADLGSGDGRIVIALALSGAEAHGYEVSLPLVWISRRNIKKAGLKGKAFIHWKSFWREDFSSFRVVTLYGIPYIMERLEKKLRKELKSGARVVSNSFTFPNWKETQKTDKVYVYTIT